MIDNTLSCTVSSAGSDTASHVIHKTLELSGQLLDHTPRASSNVTDLTRLAGGAVTSAGVSGHALGIAAHRFLAGSKWVGEVLLMAAFANLLDEVAEHLLTEHSLHQVQ